MYEKGLIKFTAPPCDAYKENYFCDCGYGHSDITDSREAGDSLPAGTAYLPHSCNEWVIGGREQIEAMIADLQDALARL